MLERGKATFNGRPAFRLLILRDRPEGFKQKMAYYVDRRTYLPLGTREHTRLKLGRRSTRVRSESVYRTYERLPDTSANRALLLRKPPRGARRIAGSALLP